MTRDDHSHSHGPAGRGLSRRQLLSRLVFASDKAREETDTHTLVVVFLRGGADTLNILVPYGDDSYYRMRPTLAIPGPASGKRESGQRAVKIDDFYGFHPGFSAMLPAFREGRLACVQAVGSDDTTGSHFSAQDQIEHGEGGQDGDKGWGLGAGWKRVEGEKVSGGWLGRHLRVMAGAGAEASPLSAVAIGSALPESLRGAPSASVFERISELQMSLPKGEDPARVADALAKMYGAQVGVLGQRGGQTLELLKRVERLGTLPQETGAGQGYDGSGFSRGLGELARLIKADVGLRVGCIDLPGWDTHFVQGGATGLQATLIQQLANGLAGFDADLHGYRGRVTTVVMTEFGRRLYENASLGTDHGRGFCMFVMGGQVAGGRVVGPWPGFEQHGFSDASLPGPGGLKVQTDYRVVLGELLTGVLGSRNIDKVFPGMGGLPGVGVLKKKGLGFKV